MLMELQNVYKEYKSRFKAPPVQVLKSINLTVHDGSMLAIKGPSGSGKSTLLQILGCLDRPTSGTYCLDGADTSAFSSAKLASTRNKRFGFVMQNYALIEDDTVLENVEATLLFSKVKKSRMYDLAMKQICALGIEELSTKKVSRLSGGERQRVAIARAMVNDPEVILADEPTGALDLDNTKMIVALFQKLNEMGKTVIIVTHDDYVADSCTEKVQISNGCISRVNY